MKYLKLIIASFGILSILITGCSNPIGNEEQNIIVKKHIVEENKYKDFKEISDSKQVQQVIEIINDIHWENAKMDMERPADYRFYFRFKNPNIEAKTVLYELWISPNKDKVDLVIDAEGKYAQLENNKSAELFEIITGEKLSELK
ncbi:hypothetical protein ABE099_05240 [Paenibacillus turicensis]|uniref:hypothetical protein n=1 Tax=Paenibacillus turicensis TaxID=160487 RepID=UPI003D27B3D8